MRAIVFLFLLLGGWSRMAFGQIQFFGCGEVIKNNYHGKVLYAIQDQANTKPFGRVVFTPEEGGHPWRFSWTYNGILQPPPADSDTVQLDVELLGSGLYTFRAEKDGVSSKSAPEFHVFFDHVPEYSIHLTDTFNCHAISIDKITDFKIPVYEYGNNEPFEGDKKYIEYLVSDKTVPRLFETYAHAFSFKEGVVAVNEKDMSVYVTITDKFGFQWQSKSDEYESVIPKAEAELKLLNTVDVVGEVNEEMGQAPLEVYFHNRSDNANSYKWLLFKDTADLNNVYVPDLRDSLIGSWIQDEFAYTYEHTGRYKVQLIAENGQGNRCRDTTGAYYVNVVESRVDVPNVFTPNGDGKNDVFMALALSVEHFHGVILNRLGRKVYEWSDPKGGWDGRIHGKYATPGTYYYIITARGLEKNNPPRYVKKGALMLIR